MVVAIFFQKFEGQGQRPNVNSIKIVHVYSGHFSNNDKALPFI